MGDGHSGKALEVISEEIFRHLVELAALELDEAEAAYLRHQMNSQLEVIRELEAIRVGLDTVITSHGVPYTAQMSPPLREDLITPSPAADDILDQAPELDGRYIVVPDIPHTELT